MLFCLVGWVCFCFFFSFACLLFVFVLFCFALCCFGLVWFGSLCFICFGMVWLFLCLFACILFVSFIVRVVMLLHLPEIDYIDVFI